MIHIARLLLGTILASSLATTVYCVFRLIDTYPDIEYWVWWGISPLILPLGLLLYAIGAIFIDNEQDV